MHEAADNFRMVDEHRAAVAAADERFNRVRRALAEHGFDLIATSHAGGVLFIVARWGLSRDLDSLASVEDFARKVGAQP